jgi:uncharacterized protein (TIGR02266 family)
MKNRKHLRVPIAVPVKFKRDSSDQTEEASIRDISWGGVLLEHQLAMGTRLLMEFDIPDQPVTLEVWGKVVRNNTDEQGKINGVGIEFDELDHESRSQIQGLVAKIVQAQFQKK